MKQQVQERLGQLAISAPPKIPPAKEFKVNTQGTCSVFLMQIKPANKAYRYDVEIIKKGAREVSITRGVVDDGARSLNKRLCHSLIITMYSKTRGFGSGGKIEYVYDGRKNLYTNCQINFPKGKKGEVIQSAEMNDFCKKFLYQADVEITLQESESFILDLNDWKPSLTSDVSKQANRDLRTFLELLTSQHAINSGEYAPFGLGKLFENNVNKFIPYENGITIRTGLAKGVRIVDNFRNPCPAIVVDMKKCAFFNEQNLAESARTVLNGNSSPSDPEGPGWKKFSQLYHNVRVYLVYASSRTFLIDGLSKDPLNVLTTKVGENQTPMSLVTYYRQQKNITLTHPNWPAVRNRAGTHFPIELCVVLPNQRVPIEKLDMKLSSVLLKNNTVKPFMRHREIMEQVYNIQLNTRDNKTMIAFGVSVDLKSNDVPMGIRVAPRIQFGNQQQIDPENGNWMRDGSRAKFLIRGRDLTWVVMFYQSTRGCVENFIRGFIQRGGLKGLTIATPGYEALPENFQPSKDMDAKFTELKKKNVQFVMFVESERNKSHSIFKLMEKKHMILTQQVTLEKARDARAQTLDNILAKFNVKRDGLNYIPMIENVAKRFDLNTGKTLVFGYDVGHPGPMTPYESKKIREMEMQGKISSLEPSVVAITGNVAVNPHQFVGDYFFQVARKESVDVDMLQDRATSLLRRMGQNRPKAPLPETLFLIRDGVSEGQIPMVVSEELPAIRKACLAFNPNFKPKLMLVIANKRHWKRFFIQNGNRIEDTVAGTTVDQKIVRADVPEFYMQSHKAILGTAKIPQYIVPINEIGINMDELQAFLNMLCNSHQIVNCAISRPEPIYQADMLAKRGRNNFLEFKRSYPHAIPYEAAHPGILINFKALNERLAKYDVIVDSKTNQFHPMASMRFTA